MQSNQGDRTSIEIILADVEAWEPDSRNLLGAGRARNQRRSEVLRSDRHLTPEAFDIEIECQGTLGVLA